MKNSGWILIWLISKDTVMMGGEFSLATDYVSEANDSLYRDGAYISSCTNHT